MKSEKNEETKENTSESPDKFGLSKEARLSSQQESQIKELGDNRFLISTSEIIQEKSADREEKEKKSEIKNEKMSKNDADSQDLELIAEKFAEMVLEKLKKRKSFEDESNISLNSLENPQKLVKLLSTYNVSLDSCVEELIKEIKRGGRKHLREELKRIFG